MVARPPVSLGILAALVGGELSGDSGLQITAVNTLAAAGPGEISFIANPKYRSQLATTRAAAVLVDPKTKGMAPCAEIVCASPYLAYARIAAALIPEIIPEPGVDASAVVASPLPASVSIAPGVVIGRNVQIGENIVIGAHCVIGDDVVIGSGCRLFAHVSIYSGVSIGARARIHAGTVIGSDGFGYARDGDRWVHIPQTGGVRIGDDVEIGAGTTIDRGALGDTVIGDGVILDNQIQIAHNVQIGAYTAMAGCVGVAGSARIGRRCSLGGGAIVLGHLELADDVHVSAGTVVAKSIRKAGQYTGVMPQDEHSGWLHNAAHLRQLDKLAKRVSELERRLSESE